jgi:hypothetical protein
MRLDELKNNQPVQVKIWYPTAGWTWIPAYIVDPYGTKPTVALTDGTHMEIPANRIRSAKYIDNPSL